MLFGLDADTITALSTAGLLIVTLVFSAVSAALAYRAQNPKPRLMIDIVGPASPRRATYRLTVLNHGDLPMQVAGVRLEHDLPRRFESETGERVIAFRPSQGELLGGQALQVPLTVVCDQGNIAPFEIGVDWHREGTAAARRTSSIFVER